MRWSRGSGSCCRRFRVASDGDRGTGRLALPDPDVVGAGAELRPAYLPPDPASRTSYPAGEVAQCDLWFPPIMLPVGFDRTRKPTQLPVPSQLYSIRSVPARCPRCCEQDSRRAGPSEHSNGDLVSGRSSMDVCRQELVPAVRRRLICPGLAHSSLPGRLI